MTTPFVLKSIFYTSIFFQAVYGSKLGTDKISSVCLSTLGSTMSQYYSIKISDCYASPCRFIASIPNKFFAKKSLSSKSVALLSCCTTIGAMTLAASKLHALTDSILLKGFILGVHTNGISKLVYAPVNSRFVNFKGVMADFIYSEKSTISAENKRKAYNYRIYIYSITSIATTCLVGNQAVGVTVGYMASALTEALALRYFNTPIAPERSSLPG